MPDKLERVVLTKAEAIAMLPDKEYIHTFRNPGVMLVGADWERRDIIKAIHKYEVELTGEQAQSAGHGMAFCDKDGWVFVETKPVKEGDIGCEKS